MTTTYTSGPWSFNGNDVIGADGFPVAEVPDMPIKPGWADMPGVQHWSDAPGQAYIERSEEEVAANGALLAAAPQLLAGVRLALAWLQDKPYQTADDSLLKKGLLALVDLAQPAGEGSAADAESIALQAGQLDAIHAYESDTFSASSAEVTSEEVQQMLNMLQRRLLTALLEGGTLVVDGVVLANLLDEVRDGAE
ncbi:MAG: hypothetical protein OHK0022_28050 [Roseiflexaceae bacterium]